MDAIRGLTQAGRRQGRRWLFASAALDEASWTLLVDGRRVAIETKPLELLHELLLRAGQVVTKDELLDAVWPGVAVVEASLPTAILKLRRALGDEKGKGRIVETVPRIGYRLAVPVELETQASPRESPVPRAEAAAPRKRPARRWLLVGGVALAAIAGTFATARMIYRPPPAAAAPAYTQADAMSAIRALDIPRIETMLAAGWDPNTPLDDQRNGALNWVLNTCEWNPAHDRERLVVMARTLIDGGARLETRNVWGDTAYSIASAPRYCGPDHPVTRMLYALCHISGHALGDRCEASYVLARRHARG